MQSMTELEKTVTLGRGVVLAILMVIGSGLLGLPGLVADSGTAQEVVFGWLLIILAAMPLIQICAGLGKKFPCSGGLFHYAREAVGEWGEYAVTALVCGSFILGEPAVALIGGEYLQHLFKLSDFGVHLLAFLLITVMTLITVAGVRLVSFFNYAAVAILLFLIAALTFYNFNFFTSGLGFSVQALFEGASDLAGFSAGAPDPYNVWKISALLFWAFLGWENMSFGLGELQNPEKNVKRVFWLSFGLTIFIYLMLAVTSIGADAAGIPLPGASGLVELVKFTPPGNLLIWLMAVVVVANVPCWNFASSRLIYASGKENVLPAYLGKLSERG
ncbi:APC family permease [Methanosarcina acetivorans]|uniref:APC family permease n=2 Tax=Methanosarcina acetivorans TaxID=2214 RepID=UPI001D04AF2F|nr:APC family permease [Methanosarcina acetivorans]